MKRWIAAAILAAVVTLGQFAQDADSMVLAYERNFARSSLVTKLELLKEAASRQDVAMGPLFDMALRFAVDNADLLGPDPQLKDLALLAATETGKAAYTKAGNDLWALFQAMKDSDVRAAALRALGPVGAGDQHIAENLNSFLASQNSLYRSGLQPEYPALEACIEALGDIGDGSSFAVLFSAYVTGYSPDLTTKASKALGSIKGDYLGYLLRVVDKNPPLEKAAAFAAGMDNAAFKDEDKGSLAEAALSAALDASPSSPVEIQSLRELRLASVRELKALKWQRASPLVIRHFNLLQADYAKGVAKKSELIEAISCLGSMGSTEAAQTLALYLQLVNAQTEQGAPYDEDVILAVIGSLGELGDKVAFDYLLQIGYLQYSDTIKRAAREALQKLKW
ncbi:MAG TPA: HEAT repeat domain-containing protein [Rectinemataceae bacterium]|nr:HEAT repeat domain-containing protein [Rectinemataceae bacterium]